jgi:hypothetical protein
MNKHIARLIIRAFGVGFFLWAFAAPTAFADIPQKLNYQGSLTNGANQPVDAPSAAPLKMTFKLFAALTGGSALYSEQQDVIVKSGVFNVQIGSVTPLTLPFDVPYFLEITIGTAPAETLNPRQPLASAAYALRSGCAPGDKVFCYTSPTGTPGVGLCQNGLRTCNAQGTGYGPCVGEVGPNCGTVCANFQTDPANCGSCGSACPSVPNGSAICAGASCGIVCNSVTVLCAGTCADTSTDPTNCGACGNHCSAGVSCMSGTCICPAGTVSCGGTCVNLTADVNNCGACGNHCPTGGTCSGGACSCPALDVICGGTCANVSNDPTNCGTCGTVCTAGHACISGVCN